LKMKNYDDLRDPEVHVPRILVVCCVPPVYPPRAEVQCTTAAFAVIHHHCVARVRGAHRVGRSPVKASVTDPAVLAAVRPLELSAYLRAHGWRPRFGEGDLEEWELDTNDGVVEVAVPKHPHWRDYARRVREVIAELSRVEGRSELLIVQDIAQTP